MPPFLKPHSKVTYHRFEQKMIQKPEKPRLQNHKSWDKNNKSQDHHQHISSSSYPWMIWQPVGEEVWEGVWEAAGEATWEGSTPEAYQKWKRTNLKLVNMCFELANGESETEQTCFLVWNLELWSGWPHIPQCIVLFLCFGCFLVGDSLAGFFLFLSAL